MRQNAPGPRKPRYVPPSGDEPLDEIEQALVRGLVSATVKQLRKAALATERQNAAEPLANAEACAK